MNKTGHPNGVAGALGGEGAKLKLTILLLCVGAIATAGVVTPDGSWQQLNNPGISTATGRVLNTGSVNNSGTTAAYWNNISSDARYSCANIGCYITNQSYYQSADGLAPGGTSPNADTGVWLGKNDGSAAQSFSFNGGIGDGGRVDLLVEIAGNRNANWLGWYDTTFTGEFTLANYGDRWGLIFDGNDAPEYQTSNGGVKQSSVLISPTENFGFWFLTRHVAWDPNNTSLTWAANRLNTGSDPNVSTTGAMFTESSRNKSISTTNQYFSLFAESQAAAGTYPAKYWVGVEDLSNGDFDYNDMIFSFSLVQTPEPGFYGVLALGLAALAIRRFGRNQ